MADKTIGELPAITSLDGDSLFVAQQQGVASKVTGAQLTNFANVETAAQVAAATAAAQGAAASETAAETAKNGAETAQTAIENMTVEAETLAAGAQATVQKIVTSGQPIKLLFGLPTGPTGPAGGVNSFNGRTGAVMPASGDYTAAMVGAAPEGYGLGTNAPRAPAGDDGLADPDLITKTGFFYAVKNLRPGGGNLWCTVLHINTTNTEATQFIIGMQYTPIGIRMKINGAWGPWEWVNPLMELGVEYRTVERYRGKPVYAKLVNCGNLTAGNVKTVNFDSSGTLQSIVEARGELFNSNESWQVSTMLYGGTYADTSPLVIAARVTSGNGIIYAYANNSGANTRIAYIVVKYTKSTD